MQQRFWPTAGRKLDGGWQHRIRTSSSFLPRLNEVPRHLEYLRRDLGFGSTANIRPIPISLSYNPPPVLASRFNTGTSRLHLLSRPLRPRRANEWTQGRAVTFIVTLAASRSVTLAAQESGMSRKAAYALKTRNPAFASAWAAALTASAKLRSREPAPSLSKGDKVHEVNGPPDSISQGDMSPSRLDRERAFAAIVARLRESPPLADLPPAQ
jgi:hypothetical protein